MLAACADVRSLESEGLDSPEALSLSLSLPLLDFIQWQINGRLARGRAKSSRINWPTKVYDLMMYRDAALIAIKIAPMDADY